MIYLRAVIHLLLGLPPPHIHEWTWGPMESTRVQHPGLHGGNEGEPFDIMYQKGRCGCGMVKTRRVT